LYVPVIFAQGFTGAKTAGSHVLVKRFKVVPVGQVAMQVPLFKNPVLHVKQEVALALKQVAQLLLHA
jgi:hypothetical protein